MKHCPFCGSIGAPRVEFDDDNDSFAVVCAFALGGCGSSSGCCDNPEHAQEEWNKRVEYPNRH